MDTLTLAPMTPAIAFRDARRDLTTVPMSSPDYAQAWDRVTVAARDLSDALISNGASPLDAFHLSDALESAIIDGDDGVAAWRAIADILVDAPTPLPCDDCGTVRCAPYGQACPR